MTDPGPSPLRVEFWAIEEDEEEIREEKEMEDPESNRLGQNVLGSEVK